MENDKFNCGVCYEDLESDQFKILECSHKLCKNCLPKLKKLECPFCRASFAEDKQPDEEEEYIIHTTTNLQNQLSVLETQYDRRLDRRRRRRERRNRNPRPRSSNHELIGVFFMDEEIESEDEILIRQQPNTDENISQQNINNRYHKSNRWNDLNRQRNLYSSSF